MRSRASSSNAKNTSSHPIITLTTDFGLSDTYVGVMKGVLLGIAPDARLVDLTHDITPQNVLEASARLESAIDYFPQGTIHLVVVDPGVGSDRAAVVVQTVQGYFVAPDNGVLTLPLLRQRPLKVVKLAATAQAYFLHPVSATFHGRDIFAPIAAHIASGLSLSALGAESPLNSPISLVMPEPQSVNAAHGVRLQVPILYSDRFGNLITALTPNSYRAWKKSLYRDEDAEFDGTLKVQAGDRAWHGIVPTFSAVEEGRPLAYWGSAGRLEIAVRNGSALREMKLSLHDVLYLDAP